MTKHILILTLIITIIFTSCSDNSTRNKFKVDQKLFKASLESFEKANEKGAKFLENLKSGQIQDGDQIFTEIKAGIAESEKVSDNYLDYIHPNLKSMYRNNFIGGYRLIIANRGSRDFQKAYNLDIQRGQMQSKFWRFLQSNKDGINAKINGIDNKTFSEKINSLIFPDKDNKSYWRMFFRFLISGFILLLVMLIYLFVLFLPLAPINYLTEKNITLTTILSYPVMVYGFIGQFYFWILWSAYIAFTVQYYLNSPTVTQSWFYYITGFFLGTGPIFWLAIKGIQLTTSQEDVKKNLRGTLYFGLSSVIVYVVFCIWPNLLEYKYISWLNDWVYAAIDN